MASAFLPSMVTISLFLASSFRRPPAIVNIGSALSGTFQPFLSAYVASKAATRAWSEALRLELLPLGVKVVHVEPGIVKTHISGGEGERWKAGEGSVYEGNRSVENWINFPAAQLAHPSSESGFCNDIPLQLRKSQFAFRLCSGSPML